MSCEEFASKLNNVSEITLDLIREARACGLHITKVIEQPEHNEVSLWRGVLQYNTLVWHCMIISDMDTRGGCYIPLLFKAILPNSRITHQKYCTLTRGFGYVFKTEPYLKEGRQWGA